MIELTYLQFIGAGIAVATVAVITMILLFAAKSESMSKAVRSRDAEILALRKRIAQLEASSQVRVIK